MRGRGRGINVSTHPPSFLFPVFSALSFWKSYYRILSLLSWISKFLSFFLPPSPPSVLLSGRFNYVSYISTDSLISATTCFTTNSIFLYLSLPYGTLETFHGSNTNSYPPEASKAVAVPSPTPWSSQSLLLSTDSPYPPRSQNLFLATLWPFLTWLVILCYLFLKILNWGSNRLPGCSAFIHAIWQLDITIHCDTAAHFFHPKLLKYQYLYFFFLVLGISLNRNSPTSQEEVHKPGCQNTKNPIMKHTHLYLKEIIPTFSVWHLTAALSCIHLGLRT